MPYASSIVFEVHRSTKNIHYVKLVYNGETIPIDDCEDVKDHGCKVTEFINSIQPRFIIAND